MKEFHLYNCELQGIYAGIFKSEQLLSELMILYNKLTAKGKCGALILTRPILQQRLQELL